MIRRCMYSQAVQASSQADQGLLKASAAPLDPSAAQVSRRVDMTKCLVIACLQPDLNFARIL